MRGAEFRVGLTHDFLTPDGTFVFGDIGLQILDDVPAICREFLPPFTDEIPPTVADQYDALLVLSPRVTESTVADCRRLKLIARFGVGYDNVDTAACTRHGVMLTITPDGVRRPVAASAMAFLLALSHRLLTKDRLTREGRWDEKLHHMGVGLTGRTLGIIGLGNIGREIVTLARPFGLNFLAFDPFVSSEFAQECGVQLADLDDLMRQSDFVCVACALTDETRYLLDDRTLQLMKSTAFLINVSRGPVVDQAALTRLLLEERIAGAALDVFETEPIATSDPLLSLDNVILSPHAVCWTDELFLGNGRAACRSIVKVAAGEIPEHVVNRDVLQEPRLMQKLSGGIDAGQ